MRCGIVVALPLTTVSSQYVIGSFEARFFARTENGIAGAAAQLRNVADSDCTHAVLRRLDEIAANGPDRSLRAVRHANLAQDVLNVLFHRLVADAERLSDFLICESKSKLLENLALALC